MDISWVISKFISGWISGYTPGSPGCVFGYFSGYVFGLESGCIPGYILDIYVHKCILSSECINITLLHKVQHDSKFKLKNVNSYLMN